MRSSIFIPALALGCNPIGTVVPTDTADTAQIVSSTPTTSTGLSCGVSVDTAPMCDLSTDEGNCIHYVGDNYTLGDISSACVGTATTGVCPAASAVGYCVLRVDGHSEWDTVTYYYNNMADPSTAPSICDLTGSGPGMESLWCPA